MAVTTTSTVPRPLDRVTVWAVNGAVKVKVRAVPEAGESGPTVPALAAGVKAVASAVMTTPAWRGMMVQTAVSPPTPGPPRSSPVAVAERVAGAS